MPLTKSSTLNALLVLPPGVTATFQLDEAGKPIQALPLTDYIVIEDEEEEVEPFDLSKLDFKPKALQYSHAMPRILLTINAPRPVPIDAETLRACVLGEIRDDRWRPHIETLLTEVAVEDLHDLVLEYVFEFADYQRAAEAWNVTPAHDVWIKEMTWHAWVRDGKVGPEPEQPPPQTSPFLQEYRRKQLERDHKD